MSFLSHGKFRERLVHTLGDPVHRSNRLIWITEEFTSKLCSRCYRYLHAVFINLFTQVYQYLHVMRRYNGYLASSRTFKCPHEKCGVHVERDGNAARNIWLWALLRAIEKMSSCQSVVDDPSISQSVVVDPSSSQSVVVNPSQESPQKRHISASSQLPRYLHDMRYEPDPFLIFIFHGMYIQALFYS